MSSLRKDYPAVVRKMLGVFTVGEEMATSVDELAKVIDESPSAVGHAKVFLDAVGAIVTRFTMRSGAGKRGAGGKQAHWTVTMSADEALAKVGARGFDFSQESRARLARELGREGKPRMKVAETGGVTIARVDPRALDDPTYQERLRQNGAGLAELLEREAEAERPSLERAHDERDRSIVGAARAGASPDDLAVRYGLPSQRVREIIEAGGMETEAPSDSVVKPSTKMQLLELFTRSSDERGVVRGITWKQVQTEIGNGVGLHSIFHLCRSLQRDGELRFSYLPNKLGSGSSNTADKTPVTGLTVVKVDRARLPSQLPPAPPERPAPEPLRQNGHERSGPVTRSYEPGKSPVQEVRYVPYLSPAGPAPEMPEAERLIGQLNKWRVAATALTVAGEHEMAEEVNRKIAGLSAVEEELIVLAEWVRRTSETAALHDPTPPRPAARA